MAKDDPTGRAWGFGREPVLWLGLLGAVVQGLAAWGIEVTQEQQAVLAVGTFAILSFVARQAVYAPKSPLLVGGGPAGPDHGGLGDDPAQYVPLPTDRPPVLPSDLPPDDEFPTMTTPGSGPPPVHGTPAGVPPATTEGDIAGNTVSRTPGVEWPVPRSAPPPGPEGAQPEPWQPPDDV